MSSIANVSWLLPLAKTELGAEEQEAVQEVIDSGWISMGPATEAFELAFAEFVGVRHAVAVSSGTAALHLAHLAAGLEPGTEAICPSLSFVATANAIVYTGARPVFADIHGPLDLNISAGEILGRISEKTRAITVMHYGGWPCDMQAIRDMAQRHSLRLIEDASHALGSDSDGQGTACGAAGDIGCFSFFANKNMTCGEGGMLVTNDPETARVVRQMRSHGMTSMTWDRHRGARHDYDVVRLGFNYRIDELRSALGLVQLRKLPELNRRRQVAAEHYRSRLRDIEEVEVPFRSTWDRSCCHLMPVLLAKSHCRDRFRETLRDLGIQTSVHYPAIHTTSYYRERYVTGQLPQTECAAARVVTLPLFPSLELEQVDAVVEGIKEALRSSRTS